MSFFATTYLGAKQRRDTSVMRWSSPFFEAFINGAWILYWTDDTLYWVAKPEIRAETTVTGRRLHNETGPAVLSDVEDLYFWHGTHVPQHWIEGRAELRADEVLRENNVERRMAGCQIIGWAKIAAQLDRRVIDGDPDTDIGALVELTLPGLPESGRFLMAQCPRNGTICEGVPRVSDIDGLPIETAIAAQAWRDALPVSEYTHPTYRC